ncbi:MAG: hypothetical protein IPL32_03480 [Chloracidobacterium sp.]|nr:hypothetical protein [Chloracidobacterium sp.]
MNVFDPINLDAVIFGRDYTELSKDEVKKIVSTIKKCVTDDWLKRGFADQLIDNAQAWTEDTMQYLQFGSPGYQEAVLERREKTGRAAFPKPCTGSQAENKRDDKDWITVSK